MSVRPGKIKEPPFLTLCKPVIAHSSKGEVISFFLRLDFHRKYPLGSCSEPRSKGIQKGCWLLVPGLGGRNRRSVRETVPVLWNAASFLQGMAIVAPQSFASSTEDRIS
ncbi:MAG: hypothetical protein H6Q48_1863 [Deltaproteobacteria bacterium]|nr:hypothetical protein [Deltaproteobacteria bacterium]